MKNSAYRRKKRFSFLLLVIMMISVTTPVLADSRKATLQPNPLGMINIYVYQYQDEDRNPVYSYTWPDGSQ